MRAWLDLALDLAQELRGRVSTDLGPDRAQGLRDRVSTEDDLPWLSCLNKG
jgi:hypothetical protein